MPWYKLDSHHAVHQITKAPTLQQMQKAIDAYMDKKIQAKATTDQNIASLQQKLQELSRHLSSGDADQVTARSSYYLQHMAGLVNQKALLEESGDTEAAKVAFQSDREEEPQRAIELVINYMHSSLHSTQGPNARVGAVRQYRFAVETALAFPKPQEWSYQLDSFTQQQFDGAQLQAPGGSAKRAANHFNALQLQNAAQLHQVNKISNQYFYDKVMTSWNVGANQGHVQDKLQALLPLLHNAAVKQQVSAQAAICQQTMAIQRQKKLEEERAQRAAARRRQAHEKKEFEHIAEECRKLEDDMESDIL
ncbi:hypothetical protein WJX77_007332 [Trebouxia sp. C0004]